MVRTERCSPVLFFHVDDFAGLGGGYSPLAGDQSMWCGARPGSVELCGYKSLPGYGNMWVQYFESVSFPSSGDVALDYKVRYDTEPGYDYIFTQYLHKNGYWVTLRTDDGSGEEPISETIPADSIDNSARIRFWMDSDGAWSDQDGLFDSDGAVILDSLTVSDVSGPLDYQDFENESMGDVTTADGDWTASVDTNFGDYSGLFDGTAVLQEDTNWTNTSYLWGFFNGSPDDYGCAGHAEQLVVPYTAHPGSKEYRDYIHNEVWSPWIDYHNDTSGMPVPWDASRVIFEFDVYRDLSINAVIYYTYRMRSLVDGCPTPWQDRDEFYYGPGKDWYHVEAWFDDLVEPGATHVQLALAVGDWCSVFCSIYGTGECHSHSPLFDNVKLSRIFEGGTAVIQTPSVETALHQCYPNPFNPVTTIAFSLREEAHVTLKIYNAAGLHVRTLIDEARPAGTHADVKWDGRDDAGGNVSSGVYFYQLVTNAFSQTRKMVFIK
ncbi:MAG: FlgD immunoglobulin-like domain containing protein [Candidatus Latescibacterota bacterium]